MTNRWAWALATLGLVIAAGCSTSRPIDKHPASIFSQQELLNEFMAAVAERQQRNWHEVSYASIESVRDRLTEYNDALNGLEYPVPVVLADWLGDVELPPQREGVELHRDLEGLRSLVDSRTRAGKETFGLLVCFLGDSHDGPRSVSFVLFKAVLTPNGSVQRQGDYARLTCIVYGNGSDSHQMALTSMVVG